MTDLLASRADAAEPVVAPSSGSAPSAEQVRSAVMTGAAIAVWFAVIGASRWWALHLEADGRDLVLYTPPVLGGYRGGDHGNFWIPVVVAVLLVGALPILAQLRRWPAVLVVSAITSLGWWSALAAIDGLHGLVRGLEWSAEFDAAAPAVAQEPGAYLASFVEQLPEYGIYIRSHPPGVPLVMGALHRAGLQGEWWAAALILLTAALGVVAVLITIRELAGEAWARRAMPFLVLAPAAMWIATSFDALFIGVGSWFVALLALACTRRARRSDALAIGAGALAFAAIMLSYGLVLLGCSAVLIALATRRVRPLVVASGTALALTLALVPLGFWWFAGFLGTSEEYFEFGLDRPYWYFVVGNVGAWALALGPATFVALTRMCDRRLWFIVGGGLGAALIADVSGMSNGEVERIWLPFTIWVVVAGAVLATTVRTTRAWLALQVLSALVLAWFVSPLW